MNFSGGAVCISSSGPSSAHMSASWRQADRLGPQAKAGPPPSGFTYARARTCDHRQQARVVSRNVRHCERQAQLRPIRERQRAQPNQARARQARGHCSTKCCGFRLCAELFERISCLCCADLVWLAVGGPPFPPIGGPPFSRLAHARAGPGDRRWVHDTHRSSAASQLLTMPALGLLSATGATGTEAGTIAGGGAGSGAMNDGAFTGALSLRRAFGIALA
ncbi:hypothetical protein OFEAOIEE_LOCUS2480 [Methylorubrum extorquens]